MRNDFWERVTDFFSEYISWGENATYLNGNLSGAAIAAAAKYLIEHDVFSDYEEIRAEALRSYGIIIPMDVLMGE